MCKLTCSLIIMMLFATCASAADLDVTFIERLPSYPYDAPKNQPSVGDTVRFVGHVELIDSPPVACGYVWYLDGLELARDTTMIQPGPDNTLSVNWVWDGRRHEIMLALDEGNGIQEESKANNVLFDFTDALIVGIRVEEGLVQAFPRFQRPLGIGSVTFADWAQRMARIWNLVLMRKAGEMPSDRTADIQDRVRVVISRHPDGTLAGGNCPMEWKEVDMLWGKLASDVPGYDTNHRTWFYEGSLPHELSHARYVPDTYIYGVPGTEVQIVDNSGANVTKTDYMPPYSWGGVYDTGQRGMMSGNYESRYGLFDAGVLNRVAGLRAFGCNTNGCCYGSGHTSDFRHDLPDSVFLRVIHLDGSPWVGARLDIFQRLGYYDGSRLDGDVDFTLFTDAAGRSRLPSALLDNTECGLFVLKITAPGDTLREYRFVERTAFHIAYWGGQMQSYEYPITTDFDPVPYVDQIENRCCPRRGETREIVFRGRNFRPNASVRFIDPSVRSNGITFVSPEEIRMSITVSEDCTVPGVDYLLANQDDKFYRVGDAYAQGIDVDLLENTLPYSRFLVYDNGSVHAGCFCFNGLWSDDWGPLWTASDVYPLAGVGTISSYSWDFGDGTYGSGPYVVHTYSESGLRTVSLQVTDEDGNTATSSRVIEVTGVVTAIRLTNLTATPKGGVILVTWESHEGQFDGFEVLRSRPGERERVLNADVPVAGTGPFEYRDSDVLPGETYSYRIGALHAGTIEYYGPVTVVAAVEVLAPRLVATPNPVRREVALVLDIPSLTNARLAVFDAAGKEIAVIFTGSLTAGYHRFAWSPREAAHRVSSGVYFVRLDSREGRQLTRLVCLK